MKPVGALMWEHRLIEQAVALLGRETELIKLGGEPDLRLIEDLIDFFRVYADRTHHGKEEDILFRALAAKPLTAEHRAIIDGLIQDHVLGRELVRRLDEAREGAASGEDAATEIVGPAAELLSLYPRHIDKEDHHFFYPIMEYFTAEEQEKMLQQFWEFDRQIVHEKYRQTLKRYEEASRASCRH